jgi:hypothetical protein
MKHSPTRRTILLTLSQVSLASALATAARGAELCADPKTMDSGQQSLRTTLHYSEQSAEQAKTCSVCGFFQADKTCGTCMIFNGPVNPKGHCDSWSAKT